MKKILGIVLVSFFLTAYVDARSCHGDKGSHRQHMQHEKDIISDEKVAVCPIMGGPQSKKYSYTYKGKTYYFCCPACIKIFKKNPRKYISKVKEFKFEAYRFGYEPEEIVVKKGDTVRLLATSRDVTHGVYIKEYGVSVTVKRGKVRKIEFIADRVGEFPILCSVYCGRGHHKMKAKLIVEGGR